MNSLAKKLSVGALSLMFLFPNSKAQPQLSKEDSIILNNINRVYNIDYSPSEFPQEKIKSSIFEDPSLYAGGVLVGTSLFNIVYARNHYALSERDNLVRTTTYVYIAGVAISVGVYFISKEIIDNKKKRRRLEKKYLGY